MERLPGFRDFYPEPLPQPEMWSADARQYIFDTWRTVARRYGFREYDGRCWERLELFTSKRGDVIGESDAAADAELLALLIDILRGLGLTPDDFVIRLSSRDAWHDFFLTHGGNPNQEYEFYQTIDKLEREDPSMNEQKLKTLG